MVRKLKWDRALHAPTYQPTYRSVEAAYRRRRNVRSATFHTAEFQQAAELWLGSDPWASGSLSHTDDEHSS